LEHLFFFKIKKYQTVVSGQKEVF